MSLQQLPVELLDGICQCVRPTDLVALSRTSSLLYPVAQRLLYRHVSVSPASRNLSVVVTLAKRPDIAHFVRSFSISVDSYSPLFHSFYRQLAVALSSMSELASLDLFVDSSASWILTETLKTTFPRLLHFASSFPFDSHVAKFLGNTPALLELEVDSIPTDVPSPLPSLPSTSITHLAQFIGSSQAAKAIVPGRPVEGIHLSFGDLTADIVERFAESTGHVVILGASTSSLPVPLLGLLAQHLPYLVYLRVMTTYNFSKAPDAVFYEDVANALAALPDLTAFELSGMHWGSSKKTDDGDRRVWQSKPLSNDVDLEAETPLDLDNYSDGFFAY